MTASYNNLASRVEVTVILTTTFKNSTYLASISNLNPPVSVLSFTSQPQSKTVDEYSLATFSCEVTGGVAPYSYQWKKNGANVGTNSTALSFTAASADKNASIIIVVTDSVGTVITSSTVILGVTSYAYQLDGVTQYIALSSTVNLAINDTVKIKTKDILGTGIRFGVLSSSASAIGNGYLHDNGNAYFRNDSTTATGTISVDGSAFTANPPFPRDGLEHVIIFKATVATSFNCLAVEKSTDKYFLNGKLFDFEVSRAAGNISIPLNNKAQGANQFATVGGIDATIINYNPAGWTPI